MSNLESIASALRDGCTFGPNRRCQCCQDECGDVDSVDRGICERCWNTIRAAPLRKKTRRDGRESITAAAARDLAKQAALPPEKRIKVF